MSSGGKIPEQIKIIVTIQDHLNEKQMEPRTVKIDKTVMRGQTHYQTK